MATNRLGRLLTLAILLKLSACQSKVPDVKIEVFKPKGFKASIPDVPNLGIFVFQGNLNRTIGKTDVGTLSGEVLQPTNGRWVYENPNIELNPGDTIYYYVFVSINREGYIKDNLSYTVPEQGDKSRDRETTSACNPTLSMVRGGRACAGDILFEDNFDELNDNAWQTEQFIPVNNPEFPFVSYQRLADPTVYTAGGYLHIKPTLQQTLPGFTNDSIYSGTLDLFSGCTSSADTCRRQASGADILPPIVSGRVTSKAFSFTYGTVEIRAKLPQGDWLYPEILLEPFLKKYGGQNYASGVIKIASARGNRQLFTGSFDYGNKVLYGGPIMDNQCRDTLLSSKVRNDGSQWGDEFHVYSIRWAPDRITLSVDGEEWARVEPAASGLRGRFSKYCNVPHSLLNMGSAMAPFDDHFYITLGVAAGSISEFRDGLYTAGGRPKPWRNQGRKAMLYFWQDMDSWLTTWNRPELLVDYVKVVAL
uniref:GNBP n=1 Tax=Antheraea pernyi TaxID=7119 RepID=V9XSA5_ANTPE|nr:GNBP [Antheraea pernyi]